LESCSRGVRALAESAQTEDVIDYDLRSRGKMLRRVKEWNGYGGRRRGQRVGWNCFLGILERDKREIRNNSKLGQEQGLRLLLEQRRGVTGKGLALVSVQARETINEFMFM
jgi:hypothetical protein